ncbi:uncharacterized protein An09g01760 [Aspergillus niger]|uniref:Contig An09c0050, genomic contig n=2 Tax=Aspergillus niger TaxID=5061 RepID=A2QTE0_ASPNC|nr:uncharacterized protein An09g01760 [Aspergillus niger]CAK40115.1 unnamed protein product [Aspergillus niger]
MDTAALLNSVTWQNTLLFAGGAYIILNLKGLPFVWHVRLLNCLKEHIILNRARQVVITTHGPQSLFYPVITTSSTPLLEIDYNMHKSNATYFTDLDINRVHLISSLFKDQLALGFSGGELNIALGSTACVFKREIKPYQAYEIHTRLLSWDEKWVYFVSHFVKTGGKKDKGEVVFGGSATGVKDEKCILASAVTSESGDSALAGWIVAGERGQDEGGVLVVGAGRGGEEEGFGSCKVISCVGWIACDV